MWLTVDVCLEAAPGEKVLCIADREENMGVVTLIAAECKARGAVHRQLFSSPYLLEQ